jgi:ribosomal protein S18 acetylase RimI-like enzyme
MSPGLDAGGLVLRTVTRADAEVLFRWLNAADRRATSLQTSESVAWEDHLAWFDRHFADPDGFHAIALLDGQPAGQVRAERAETGVIVSIYVDESFRNRGVGRSMIEAVCSAAHNRWPGLPVLAQVRPDNPGSVAFFTRNGFSEMQRQADRVILQRMP